MRKIELIRKWLKNYINKEIIVFLLHFILKSFLGNEKINGINMFVEQNDFFSEKYSMTLRIFQESFP